MGVAGIVHSNQVLNRMGPEAASRLFEGPAKPFNLVKFMSQVCEDGFIAQENLAMHR